jgi:hypothetical protein
MKLTGKFDVGLALRWLREDKPRGFSDTEVLSHMLHSKPPKHDLKGLLYELLHNEPKARECL